MRYDKTVETLQQLRGELQDTLGLLGIMNFSAGTDPQHLRKQLQALRRRAQAHEQRVVAAELTFEAEARRGLQVVDP